MPYSVHVTRTILKFRLLSIQPTVTRLMDCIIDKLNMINNRWKFNIIITFCLISKIMVTYCPSLYRSSNAYFGAPLGAFAIALSSRPQVTTSNVFLIFFHIFVEFKVQHKVNPQVHLSMSCFVQSCALKSAPTCATSSVTQF